MAKAEKEKKQRVKGELLTKIVWIIGAVFLGFYAVTVLGSMGKEYENPADCLRTGIPMLLYCVAFVLGVIYLFNGKKDRFVFVSAVIYAVGRGLNVIFEFTDGGVLAGETIMNLIVSLIGYVLFAVFMGILAKGQPADRFEKCLKFWYIPTLVLVLAGVISALWTEVVRPAGFLLDGLVVDLGMLCILVAPIFLMSLVVRGRKIARQ